jgi:flavin reductase (DIM6/NTAB) family NADH-FMN oxidoreductase RutF
MITLFKDDINAMHRIERLNLINSVTGFKPANLVATKSKDGHSNVAIISSIVHLGSDPGLIGFISRPMTVSRHTAENIFETNFYTINHVNADIIKKAHWTSVDVPKEVSEFEICGLTPKYRDEFYAPFVQESHISIGMSFVEQLPISINNTFMIIGKIEVIYLDSDYRLSQGNLDLIGADTVAISGLDTYHSISQGIQLPYAKLENKPTF